MRKESRLFQFPGEFEFECCWSARGMWDPGIDLDGENPPRGLCTEGSTDDKVHPFLCISSVYTGACWSKAKRFRARRGERQETAFVCLCLCVYACSLLNDRRAQLLFQTCFLPGWPMPLLTFLPFSIVPLPSPTALWYEYTLESPWHYTVWWHPHSQWVPELMFLYSLRSYSDSSLTHRCYHTLCWVEGGHWPDQDFSDTIHRPQVFLIFLSYCSQFNCCWFVNLLLVEPDRYGRWCYELTKLAVNYCGPIRWFKQVMNWVPHQVFQ